MSMENAETFKTHYRAQLDLRDKEIKQLNDEIFNFCDFLLSEIEKRGGPVTTPWEQGYLAALKEVEKHLTTTPRKE